MAVILGDVPRREQRDADKGCLGRIHNSYHTESWEQMSAIKSRILQMWDGAAAPVKLSCIKFAQRVVLAQTASNGMEQKVGFPSQGL
jgi:hypothetical protein